MLQRVQDGLRGNGALICTFCCSCSSLSVLRQQCSHHSVLIKAADIMCRNVLLLAAANHSFSSGVLRGRRRLGVIWNRRGCSTASFHVAERGQFSGGDPEQLSWCEWCAVQVAACSECRGRQTQPSASPTAAKLAKLARVCVRRWKLRCGGCWGVWLWVACALAASPASAAQHSALHRRFLSRRLGASPANPT